MTYFRLALLFVLLFLSQSCKEKPPQRTPPLNAELLPSNAMPFDANINNLNCWVEKNLFCVAGICNNPSAEWKKIWLLAEPLNAQGKPVSISKHYSVIVATFSEAVPPAGRTSFFASWSLTDFSEKPDSCKFKVAGATTPAAGPILVAPLVNAMKMFAPAAPGQAGNVEKGWQLSGTIINPLDRVANHPRMEILVFGTDNLLWLSTLLNPEDPAIKSFFHFDREGPMQPREERAFDLQVYYEGLPEALKEKKIGRIEVLPFDAR